MKPGASYRPGFFCSLMLAMTPEIETYLDQLLSIRQDAPGIVAGLSDDQFNWTPEPGRWSIGQCFDHLNLIGEAYLPVLDAAIGGARSRGQTAPGPFAYGWIERWFVRSMEPPPRRRFGARKKFASTRQLPADACLQRFLALQQGLDDRLRQADGLHLRAIKVRSQAAPISFSLGSTFGILLAHERRHLWQAREVRKALEQTAGTGRSGR